VAALTRRLKVGAAVVVAATFVVDIGRPMETAGSLDLAETLRLSKHLASDR